MPPAFFATTVSVEVVEPTARAEAVVVILKVDPETRIGICDVTPLAVATTVAVRVVALLPAENVAVALPLLSLTALDVLRNPLSTENAIGTFATAALEELTTVAVTVTEVLLSDRTDAADVLRLMPVATGAAAVVATVVDVPDPPPPQAASRSAQAIANRTDNERDELIFNVNSPTTMEWLAGRHGAEPGQ